MNRHGLIIVVGMLTAASASGQLLWHDTELELQARAFGDDVVGEFVFENVGEAPITITAVRSSCGCTVATLDEYVYEPGSVGVITATFGVGSRRGMQSKSIVVRSDDPTAPVTTLSLKVNIDEPVSIEPRSLSWRSESEPTPRRVRIVVNQDEPAVLQAISFEGESFATSVKTIEPGRLYELTTWPIDQVAGARGAVELSFGGVEGQGTERLRVPLSVRGPRLAASGRVDSHGLRSRGRSIRPPRDQGRQE